MSRTIPFCFCLFSDLPVPFRWMAKVELKIHPGTIRLQILPGIEITNLSSKDIDELMSQVRSRLAAAIDEECIDVAVRTSRTTNAPGRVG